MSGDTEISRASSNDASGVSSVPMPCSETAEDCSASVLQARLSGRTDGPSQWQAETNADVFSAHSEKYNPEIDNDSDCMPPEEVERLAAVCSGEDDDDSDDDGECIEQNEENNKKVLAVSSNRSKYASFVGAPANAELTVQQRWKTVVAQIDPPLSSILARSRVDCLTSNSAVIAIPICYKGIITDEHVLTIDRILSRAVASSCRLSLSYDSIGDDADTLAAQEARDELARQKAEIDKVRELPILHTIMETFRIDPQRVRFSFNQNRNSK